MCSKSVNFTAALLVATCLILSVILFQMNAGKAAYGSMSVTGQVLDSLSASGPGNTGVTRETDASRQPQTPLAANGSAFTYQGRLLDGGNPANGNYDFQFSLYDDGVAGSQVGSTVSVNAQAVSSGLFTASLDFGSSAFVGEARWLQIAVRQTGGGAYTPLSPRQPITSAPYAGSAPWFGVSGKPFPYSPLRQANTNAALDTAGATGRNNSTTVGADGLGLISYYNATTGELKVAHCQSLQCSSAAIYVLDSTGNVGNTLSTSSITLGADGLGLISYYDANNGDLRVAHCFNLECSTSTNSTVDSTGNIGQLASITTGPDGFGLIAYYDSTNSDLKVAHCSNATCTGSTPYVVDSVGNVGYSPSITLGSDGLGLISYYDGSAGNLKVAHCSNAECSTATTYTMANTGGAGYYSSIAIGTDGLPLISHYDLVNFDLKMTHCSNALCSASTTYTLDSTNVVGRYTSMTIGADGMGLISYEDFTNGTVKVAHCSDYLCSSATTHALEYAGPPSNNLAIYSSATLGADGLPLIAYYDLTIGDLKVDHCAGSLCLNYQHRR
jgi:hypothetical protein